MAGGGFRTFAVGEVLTATNVNNFLMEQTVMVFTNSSARSTALGANVAEGMVTYLTADNSLWYYSGTAWTEIVTDPIALILALS
jgi:hypothetical protein